MIKPIPVFKNYFVCGEKTLGISNDGLTEFKIEDVEEIPISLNSFFIIDGKIYIAISATKNIGTEEEPLPETVSEYYMQKDGVISQVDEFPDMPTIGYSTYKSKNFTLMEDSYDGYPISRIRNLSKGSQAVFKQICGVSEISTGLYFNVIESRIPGKQTGLYFFPKNRNAVDFISSALNFGYLW